MFDHRHYVPILKWKQGEYLALEHLHDEVKENLTPLLEIPPIGYDFERATESRTIDAHLEGFGKRLASKWGGRQCFVDTNLIPRETRMADGRHFVQAVFDDARNNNCGAIPVVHLADDEATSSAIASTIGTDRRGMALRLILPDFDRPNLSSDIETILADTGLNRGDVHLILDAEAPNFGAINVFVSWVQRYMSMIPHLDGWQTFVFAATSYPSSVSHLQAPFEQVPRFEWSAYQELVNRLDADHRKPTFGDYAVAHPRLVEFDMRQIRPSAKLRYTADDFWHIGKGTNVRDDGFEQYRDLCQTLTEQSYFDGSGYSYADDYIVDCAQGAGSTGNLSVWVRVAMNRHFTKVVKDLANFHAP